MELLALLLRKRVVKFFTTMAVERFYSGDPLSASKFNRLVTTICNLQRKVNELKRRPKSLLLRNDNFARYRSNGCAGCACGFINCYCVKLCVGQFPIYKPPFNMHWKTTEINGSEVRTDTLQINRGFWFRGSDVVEIPAQQIQGAPKNGSYYIMRCGTEFVRGQTSDTGLLPCNVWAAGVVSCGCITAAWSGDIYQEPPPFEPDILAITDIPRFVSNVIKIGCYGLTTEMGCRFIPARGIESGEYENPPQHCEGAYMLFSGTAGDVVPDWYAGCTSIACSIPQLCVNIHGQCAVWGMYDGQNIYVDISCQHGYRYRGETLAQKGVIMGYSRHNPYRCVAYSCVWLDVPIILQQNAVAFWGAEQENCFQGSGRAIYNCWQPNSEFTVLQRSTTEVFSSSEIENWWFKNYIADVVLCKKEPANTVYSLPKKSTISETYYTGENSNGA